MPGLKYISLLDSGGYDIAARMYLKSLIQAGHQVTWLPMIPGRGLGSGYGYEPYDGHDVDDLELKPICNRDIPYDLVIVHTVPEYFPYWKSIECGKKIIGMTVWETNVIPHHWRDLLNLMDSIIVPTNWNRKIFTDCGVSVPIHVLPHMSEFNGLIDSRLGRTSRKFVFYSIADWTNRKTPNFTIEAFVKAFTHQDDVKLILKTSRLDYCDSRKFRLPWMKRYHRTKSTFEKLLNNLYPRHKSGYPEIDLIDRKISPQEIQALHQNSDCFISLCRAEGWGLPAYEAGWYGNPVVMTGFGGQMAFLPAEYAFIVDFDLVPVQIHIQDGGKSYSPDQKWAAPNIDHAIRILRNIYEDPESAINKGALLKNHLTQNFDTTTIFNQFIKILDMHHA